MSWRNGGFPSPLPVFGVWKRQGLENLNKRLRALEATVARESHILTEAQLAALEKAKVEKEAQRELESECPG